MYPRLKFYSLLLFTLAFPLQELHAAIHRYELKEFYADGRIKSVTITKVTTPRNIDLFNFYKETKVIKTVYDSATGNKVMHSVRITKVGVGGKHCYEYSSRFTNYDKNGLKTYSEKGKCDKHKYEYIWYEKGKVSFIHKEKKRRRR
jgi:hypothetical protein